MDARPSARADRSRDLQRRERRPRLNGCPAERAGGRVSWLLASNGLTSQWMPGRARGRTDEQRLGRLRREVSMDARPSARADLSAKYGKMFAGSSLNGCPAERAGGLERALHPIIRSVSQWMPGRARGRTCPDAVMCADCGRLNGCPAERAGGPPSGTGSLTDLSRLNGCPAERAGGPVSARKWVRGSRRLNGCPAERAGGQRGWRQRMRAPCVSMDARPSARADAQAMSGQAWQFGSQWMPGRARGRTLLVKDVQDDVYRRLNGCPAERAGGHSSAYFMALRHLSQWMPGRARGRTSRWHPSMLAGFVSMDARPSARADNLQIILGATINCLNGCPAERAGGRG